MSGYSQNGPVRSSTDRAVGGGCDGCVLIYEGMPSSLDWETTLPPGGEPGQPLIISGTIYKRTAKHLPQALSSMSITPIIQGSIHLPPGRQWPGGTVIFGAG